MTDADLPQRVEAVRRFNRFYTRQIGVLQEGLLDSPFSLTEGRVLYELAHRDTSTATELAKDLRLDAGYLSRILRGFEGRDLVARRPAEADARQNVLSLTDQGREAFATINARSRDEIARMLERLEPADQDRLVAAMEAIQTLLAARPERKVPYILRSHRPGDLGWIVHRHGVLYAEEYGWDERFEALVASVAAEFIAHFDPKRERCWIAEMEGEIVGAVLLVKDTDAVAKLRLLLVEPKARGLGIGSRLVEECMRFARQAGYTRISLWTNSVLLAARHIYERAGFRLVRAEPHHSFGHDLVGETWEREL